MAKVNVGRQGFLTKSALPVVTRQRGTTNVNLSLLLNANQTTDNTSNINVVDSSSYNRFVSYYSGILSQVQFSPFGTGIGGSVRFDGAGDFLQVNNATELVLGTGDFTIEMWIWMTAAPGSTGMYLYDQRNSATQITPTLYISNTGPSIRYFVNGADRITGGNITAQTWTHIALVRISGVTTLYLNGTISGSTYSDTNNYIGNTSRPVIGMNSTGTWGSYSGLNTNGPFRGFISNLRVVKGIGVYTGNFTVPTSPLTATQSAGTNIAAISGTETSLLLNGTNYMVVDSSTANPKGLAPFGPTFTMTGGQVNFHPYSGSGKYGSYWFDGTFSFIDTPAQNVTGDYSFNGDFTIEAWIYKTSASNVGAVIVGQFQNGAVATNANFILSLTNSGFIQLLYGIGSTQTIAVLSSTVVASNTWNHIAVVRSSGTIRAYLNGVAQTPTSTNAGTTNNLTGFPLRIGAFSDGASVAANSVLGLGNVANNSTGMMAGYMTGLRIVNGTAVYTGNFTPPSIQPVDVSGAASAASYPSTTNVNTSFASTQTSLLCKFDRWTLQDNDTLPKPIYLIGNAQTSTAQAKFGAASLTAGTPSQFNSIVCAGAPMNIGTGDFTIQCWLYTSTWSGQLNMICYTGAQPVTGSGANVQQIYINPTGVITLERYGVGGTNIATINTATYTNVWFHFACVRRSGTITVYIDGQSVGTTAAWNGVTIGNAGGFWIGNQFGEGQINNGAGGNARFWPGFIDDFNIANTAIYISNFTPPTTQATDPYVAPNIISNSVYGAYQNY